MKTASDVTDGVISWRRPTGCNFIGGVEVVEVLRETNEEVEYIVAPRHVANRGDTLNCKPSAPSLPRC